MENVNCKNKISYNSQKEANTARNCVKKHSKRSHIPKRAYYCKGCGNWHLTSLKNKIDYLKDE